MQPKYSILGCSIDQILTSHINELRPCWLCKLLLIIMEKNHLDCLVRHQCQPGPPASPPGPAQGFDPVLYCQVGKIKRCVNLEFPVSCPVQRPGTARTGKWDSALAWLWQGWGNGGRLPAQTAQRKDGKIIMAEPAVPAPPQEEPPNLSIFPTRST